MRINCTGVTCEHKRVICFWACVGLLLAPALSLAQAPPSFSISTIVGTGTAGFAGDSGPAASAQINNPCALALDGSGNLYIGDELNFRIRKVTTDGNIATIVGTGTAGDSGTTASTALIRSACGLVLDGSGNLFFSDTTNSEVKKVTSGGTQSTIAGTGSAGISGNGNSGTTTLLNNPVGIAIDSGGVVYFADSASHVVRKILTTGIVQGVAGDGLPGYYGDGADAGAGRLSNPTGLVLDASGNLYIADTGNSVIRKVTPGGIITTVAGNGFVGYSGDEGPATSATLGDPRGVAVDGAGNLYIADTLNNRIRIVTPDGKIHTIAGTGTLGYGGDGGVALRAQLHFPSAVRVSGSGNVYVADTQNSVIRLLTPVAVTPSSAPSIKSGGVVSSTEFGGFRAVAPGSWIEIYGASLAGVSRSWTFADFEGVTAPTSLGGTTVTIGGQKAFVYYVSPGQLNVQVPSTVGPGPQQLTVTTAAGTSAPYTVTVNSTQPGLYTNQALQIGGAQFVGAVLNDGTGDFVLPVGAVPGIHSRPARPGEIITLFGVGFGPVTPNEAAGQVVQQDNALTTPVQFSVGQTPAAARYAGLAPQTVGLYQFNVVVPNVAAGAVPLTFSLGGVRGTQTLYIAVGN